MIITLMYSIGVYSWVCSSAYSNIAMLGAQLQEPLEFALGSSQR